MKQRAFGWRKELKDQRDFLYKLVAPEVALPDRVDLRLWCSPIEDQGSLGSCTAQAIAGHLEFLELMNKVNFMDVSRLFIYYNERVLEGTTAYDAGAYIRDGIKSLNNQGWCDEKKVPYVIQRFAIRPSFCAYQEAKANKISSYYRIQTLNEMFTCLANGFPFIFGFTVYESFTSKEVQQTGIVNMPQPNEKVIGGHAVLAVGYDDSTQRFLVRNSWGTDWGQQGYFTMPYQYLTDLSDDMWTIRK